MPHEDNSDSSVQVYTFSLTDDANGRFTIDNVTGEVTLADTSQLDVDTATFHEITVEDTDADNNSYSEVVSVTVDGIQSVVSLDLPTSSVNENSADGTIVGVVTVDGSGGADVATILNSDPSLVYDATTNKFYKAVEGDFTWAASNTAATSTLLGGASGQLVTIRSQEENDIVQGLANTLSTPELSLIHI